MLFFKTLVKIQTTIFRHTNTYSWSNYSGANDIFIHLQAKYKTQEGEDKMYYLFI